MVKFKKLFLLILTISLIYAIPKDTFAAPVPGNTQMLIRFNYINDLNVQPLQYSYREGTYQQFGSGGSGFYVKHMGALLTGIGGVDSNWTYNARVRFIIRGSALDWGDNANFGVVCNQYSSSLSNASSTMISHNRVYLNSGGQRIAIGHEIVCGYAYQSADPTYHEFFLQGNLSYNQGGVVNSNLFNNSPITANTTYFYYDIEEWTADTGNNTIIITQNNTMIAQNESIINGQREINDNINELKDIIDSDEVNADSKLDDLFSGKIDYTSTPIIGIFRMPITFLQKILNSVNGTCSSFNLGRFEFANYSFVLPCITPSRYLTSNSFDLWTIITGLFNMFMIYNIGVLMFRFYECVTDLKSPLYLLFGRSFDTDDKRNS